MTFVKEPVRTINKTIHKYRKAVHHGNKFIRLVNIKYRDKKLEKAIATECNKMYRCRQVGEYVNLCLYLIDTSGNITTEVNKVNLDTDEYLKQEIKDEM